jgi:hypothetical protein
MNLPLERIKTLAIMNRPLQMGQWHFATLAREDGKDIPFSGWQWEVFGRKESVPNVQ